MKIWRTARIVSTHGVHSIMFFIPFYITIIILFYSFLMNLLFKGFVGDIDSNPQISCVYQSDDAQNEFLSNPKVYIIDGSLMYLL